MASMLALLAAGHAAPAEAQAKATAGRLTLCRPGPVEPPRSEKLRGRPTAICPYDLKGLYQRIGALLNNPDGRGYGAEKARYRFGLPAFATSYDSDRIANYPMGVSGAGGWTMQLVVTEARYPLDGKPAVFTPGIHSTRLVDIDALDVDYSITLVLPDDAKATDRCMSVQDAAQMLERAGWKDDTAAASFSVTDGGHADPTFIAPQGGSTIILKMDHVRDIATRDERAAHCLLGVHVMQPPLGEAKP